MAGCSSPWGLPRKHEAASTRREPDLGAAAVDIGIDDRFVCEVEAMIVMGLVLALIAWRVLIAALAESGFDGEKILALAQTRDVEERILELR
jgi:hypothetical protein